MGKIELSKGILLGSLLSFVAVHAFAADGPKPVELKDCDANSKCVSMLLDVDPESESAIIISPKDIDSAQSSDGYTLFHVRFEGRLKGKTQTVEATFQGYTDGIHCTAFGQGTVGFLGYSGSGDPIINSSAGPIEVTDARLKVGCADCLVVHDSKTDKSIVSLRSPGFDTSLTGHKPADFFYDTPGGYNVKSGSMCLRVQDKGPVQSVYPERCEALPKAVKLEFKDEACT